MIRQQPRLRQKLLLLLVFVGGVGLAAFSLVLVLADQHLFDRFVPENQALRQVETRSALLLQNYYRFMLNPEIISQDELDSSIVLIRQNLDRYQELIAGQPQKEELAIPMQRALDKIEQAGAEMLIEQQYFAQIFSEERALATEIDQMFSGYQNEVNRDIGHSIDTEDWPMLTNEYLPELRMIESIHLQYLQLFHEIRHAHQEAGVESIEHLKQRLGQSNTMFELYQENSAKRASLAGEILEIYADMLVIVDRFTNARQRAEYAVSRAEQAGIDLSQAISDASAATEIDGWSDLRELLVLSGGVLLLTLLVSYLFIYAGLNRIVSPLENLQTVINRLGQGDWHQRADFERDDELGMLAGAFNRMADQLEENAEQKQQFIDQLEQKNMELERFTYTVSHELKSPLVTVSGFLGLLEKDLEMRDQARIDDDMNKIAEAIEVMSKQLEDLLELSRVGRVANPPTSFSITEICQEVVEMMQGLISERDAAIEIDENMPAVLADQARIREVIKNLVENGIKFAANNRQPRISINAHKDQDRILCRVQDNGPGIEPRYQDKVFGLFDRLETGVPGTGIGLALVKRIVEIHNGDIWIESQGDGQGCCFCFTLPAEGGT